MIIHKTMLSLFVEKSMQVVPEFLRTGGYLKKNSTLENIMDRKFLIESSLESDFIIKQHFGPKRENEPC